MDNEAALTATPTAREKKRRLARSFFVKGLIIALISGATYGLYSAFLAGGMSFGVWADWYGNNSAGLTAFTIVYVLGMLGSGINDLVSAVWAVGIATVKGKFMDFLRTLRSKPGLVMILCAIFGGPIANGAYIIALQLAGSAAAPITALCPIIGAILSRILFRQELNARMAVGIIICICASLMIGGVAFISDVPEGYLLGIAIAFIAALGWGVEGCIAGYGTSVIDYEIGISIRQFSAGIINLGIFVPVFAILAGNIGLAPQLFTDAILSWPAMLFFIASGFFSYKSFGLWYKGNSMCGTALGMASNASYSFFTPLFCWILLGGILGQAGWDLQPITWVAAFVMFFGIVLVAVNPLTIFKRDEAPAAGKVD
jgi:drug/metabolite transporter (DMT)-like permease